MPILYGKLATTARGAGTSAGRSAFIASAWIIVSRPFAVSASAFIAATARGSYSIAVTWFAFGGQQRAGQPAGPRPDFNDIHPRQRFRPPGDARQQVRVEQKMLPQRFIRPQIVGSYDLAERG